MSSIQTNPLGQQPVSPTPGASLFSSLGAAAPTSPVAPVRTQEPTDLAALGIRPASILAATAQGGAQGASSSAAASGLNVNYSQAPESTGTDNFQTACNMTTSFLTRLAAMFTQKQNLANPALDAVYRDVRGLQQALWAGQTSGLSRSLPKAGLQAVVTQLDTLNGQILDLTKPITLSLAKKAIGNEVTEAYAKRDADIAAQVVEQDKFKGEVGAQVRYLVGALGFTEGVDFAPEPVPTPQQNFRSALNAVESTMMRVSSLFTMADTLNDDTLAANVREIEGLQHTLFQLQITNPSTALSSADLLGVLSKLEGVTGTISKFQATPAGTSKEDKAADQALKDQDRAAFKSTAGSLAQELAGLLHVPYNAAPAPSPQETFKQASNLVNSLMMRISSLIPGKEVLSNPALDTVYRQAQGLSNAIWKSQVDGSNRSLDTGALKAIFAQTDAIAKQIVSLSGGKDAAERLALSQQLTTLKEGLGPDIDQLSGLLGFVAGTDVTIAPPPSDRENFQTGLRQVNGMLMRLNGQLSIDDTLGDPALDSGKRTLKGLQDVIFKLQVEPGAKGLSAAELLTLTNRLEALDTQIHEANRAPTGKTDADKAADKVTIAANLAALKSAAGGAASDLAGLLGVTFNPAPAASGQDNFRTAAGLVTSLTMKLTGLYSTKAMLDNDALASTYRDARGLLEMLWQAQGSAEVPSVSQDSLKAVVARVEAMRGQIDSLTKSVSLVLPKNPTAEQRDQAIKDRDAAKAAQDVDLVNYQTSLSPDIRQLASDMGLGGTFRPAAQPSNSDNFRTAVSSVSGLMMRLDGLFALNDRLNDDALDKGYRSARGLTTALWEAQANAVGKELTPDSLRKVLDLTGTITADLQRMNATVALELPTNATDDEKAAARADQLAKKEALKQELNSYKPRVTQDVGRLVALLNNRP